MNNLIAKWEAGECPILNGVTLNGGQHYPIKPVDAPRNQLPMHLTHGQPAQLSKLDQLEWAFVNILCEATNAQMSLRASAGEGSMGGDGVIALCELTGVLRWVAFFDFSNPFERLRFDGADLVAENNLGEAWRLPLAQPWKIIVDAAVSHRSQRPPTDADA